jgi:DNA-binding transcriptional MerR regulator
MARRLDSNDSNGDYELTKEGLKKMGENQKYMKAYTVAEVSKILDVPPGTVRQWERSLEGVLDIPRDEKGARYYTEFEIHALRNVKNMREKGLGFELIREVLNNSEGPSEMVPIPSVPTMSQSEAIEALRNMQNAVSQLTSRMEETVQKQVRQEVAAVLEENQRMHNQLETRLEQRDKLLIQTLRTMQDAAKEQQRNRKRGSWNLWPFRK